MLIWIALSQRGSLLVAPPNSSFVGKTPPDFTTKYLRKSVDFRKEYKKSRAARSKDWLFGSLGMRQVDRKYTAARGQLG